VYPVKERGEIGPGSQPGFGVGQCPPRARVVVTVGEHPALIQGQPRRLDAHCFWQRFRPAQDRLHPAAREQLQRYLLHQRDRLRPGFGGQVVVHCLLDVVVSCKVLRCAPVQVSVKCQVVSAQLLVQKVAE